MGFYEGELEEDVIPRGEVGGLEEGGVGGVEGHGHEEAVEPHLVGVFGVFVPEAAGGGAFLVRR